jgi:hypothetical protein
MILNDFKKILSTHILSLGEFAEFAKQLEKAGYILSVTTSKEGVRFLIEEPNLIQLVQRIISTITKKRLKLTRWQEYVFFQAVHYNFKPTQSANFDKPVWVKRALQFKPKKEMPYNSDFKQPNWVTRAIRFHAKPYYSREAVEHG